MLSFLSWLVPSKQDYDLSACQILPSADEKDATIFLLSSPFAVFFVLFSLRFCFRFEIKGQNK